MKTRVEEKRLFPNREGLHLRVSQKSQDKFFQVLCKKFTKEGLRECGHVNRVLVIYVIRKEKGGKTEGNVRNYWRQKFETLVKDGSRNNLRLDTAKWYYQKSGNHDKIKQTEVLFCARPVVSSTTTAIFRMR